MENTPAWASSCNIYIRTTDHPVISKWAYQGDVGSPFSLKKTVLQLALYNYQMRGISEAGSGPYCLVSEQSVVKKETAAAYYFFPQNYYLESERGLL